MSRWIKFDMVEGGEVHLKIGSIVAISPAYKQSAVASGASLVAGTMVVIEQGQAYPVRGTPSEVVEQIVAATQRKQ